MRINANKTGFGQIINIPNKNNFIIVVFKNIYIGQDWPGLGEIINDEVLFIGYTMDAKLYHKHWNIIGNDCSNLGNIKLPYYKLGIPPDYKLVDYKGDIIRQISRPLFDQLDYQEIIAPVRYENALKAYHKLSEWRKDYDELLYSKTIEGVGAVEGKGTKQA